MSSTLSAPSKNVWLYNDSDGQAPLSQQQPDQQGPAVNASSRPSRVPTAVRNGPASVALRQSLLPNIPVQLRTVVEAEDVGGGTSAASYVRFRDNNAGVSILFSRQQQAAPLPVSAVTGKADSAIKTDAAGNMYVYNEVPGTLVQVLLVTNRGVLLQATAYGNFQRHALPPLQAAELLALLRPLALQLP